MITCNVFLCPFDFIARNILSFILIPFEPVHEVSNNVVCATSAQSDQSLC